VKFLISDHVMLEKKETDKKIDEASYIKEKKGLNM